MFVFFSFKISFASKLVRCRPASLKINLEINGRPTAMFSSLKKQNKKKTKNKYNLLASLDGESMRRGRVEILDQDFVWNSRTECQNGKITRSSIFTAMDATLVLLHLLQTFLTLTYVSCSIAQSSLSFCQGGTAFSNFSKTILKILSILEKWLIFIGPFWTFFCSMPMAIDFSYKTI